MLTARQAFKAAFLARCADEGLSIEETHQRVKQALATVRKQAGVWDTITGLPKSLSGIVRDLTGAGLNLTNMGEAAAVYGLLAPAAIGAAGGAGLAQVHRLNDINPEEVKNEELADEYRRRAEEARNRRAQRQQQLKNRAGRVIV